MKFNIIWIICSMVVLFFLTSHLKSTVAYQDDRFVYIYSQTDRGVIEDEGTGCRYLIVWGEGTGVTPLLKSDGTPDCGKKKPALQ